MKPGKALVFFVLSVSTTWTGDSSSTDWMTQGGGGGTMGQLIG